MIIILAPIILLYLLYLIRWENNAQNIIQLYNIPVAIPT